jgi:hypothetical protein
MGVLPLGVQQRETRQGELLGLTVEEITRATHALEALVFLYLLPCPREAVTRFSEQHSRLTQPRHRRIELVHRLGHDVLVLARLRLSVRKAGMHTPCRCLTCTSGPGHHARGRWCTVDQDGYGVGVARNVVAVAPRA